MKSVACHGRTSTISRGGGAEAERSTKKAQIGSTSKVLEILSQCLIEVDGELGREGLFAVGRVSELVAEGLVVNLFVGESTLLGVRPARWLF